MSYSDSLTSLLIEEILAKNLSRVKELLKDGVDVNHFDEDNQSTPLTQAIEHKWIEGIQLFIEAGADIHFCPDCEWTPLGLAVNLNDPTIVKVLLQAGANANRGGIGSSPLHNAIARECIEIVRMLIEAGANINGFDIFGETPLMIAAYKGNLQIVQLLVKTGAGVDFVSHESGETALVMAAANGHREVFEYLLPLATCPQQREYAQQELIRGILRKQRKEDRLLNGFITAIKQGNVKAIRESIAAGVDPNAFWEDGKTALHIAVATGNIEVAHTLLEVGTDPEKRAEDNQWTPLMEASQIGNTNMVRLLIEAGAKLELSGDITPLMLAADANCLGVVKVLIEAGADVNAKDNAERNALYYARQNEHTAVIQALKEAGAIEDDEYPSKNIEF